MSELTHDTLPCGLEYGVVHLPGRHVVSFQIRVLAGAAADPLEKLGLGSLVEDTLDKGTEKRTGQELADAFDAIGAGRDSGTGRETTTFTCTVLPEHFERAVELHAEFLRTPTFPKDAFDINLQLAQQELTALEDDAHALADKYLSLQAFGPVLGRYPVGEPETLRRITRADVEQYWRDHYHAGRMVATVGGPLEAGRVAETFARHFDGFGVGTRAGRDPHPVQFTARTTHYPKQLQQEQIGIAWPGVTVTHEDFPVQQVTLGILAGGMSGRLFTEVREKRGLVYWVSAWHDTPRGTGRMFLGASTTPERSDQTFATLLREVDRLEEDIEPDELERAITGIVARRETRGDTTQARCSELANDLFFFGRPVPPEEKIEKVQAVTLDGIRRYLADHPRDRLCVVTLGPRALTDEQVGTVTSSTGAR